MGSQTRATSIEWLSEGCQGGPGVLFPLDSNLSYVFFGLLIFPMLMARRRELSLPASASPA